MAADFGSPSALQRSQLLLVVGTAAPRAGNHDRVGYDEQRRFVLRPVHAAARVHNRANVDNEENGHPITICTEQRAPWSAIWSHFKHYG